MKPEAGAQSTQGYAETAGMRIMLVEDDHDSGPALKAMLERRRVAVRLVTSAEEAVSAFAAAELDAVVADIRLGGMSGVDLLAWIRERDETFPVILLTGFDSLSSAIQAVRLGAQDYILKPLDGIEDLLNPIARAVQHHRLLQQNRALVGELEQSRDQLRLLNARLLDLDETERRRLGTELHDSVAQDLAVLGINVGMALESIPDRPDESRRFLEKAREIIGGIAASVRGVMHELLPDALEHFGVGAAVREHCRLLSRRTGIAITVDGDFKERLPAHVEIGLFRIAQEALANTVKHSGVRHAHVCLEEADGVVRLVVKDDGAGFDTKAVRRPGRDGGWGLALMSERGEGIGGRLEVRSEPGKGTRIAVELTRRQEG